ncbi:MAG: tetratricopeptide repeat protein [Thermodesulfobacteriota bacterium]
MIQPKRNDPCPCGSGIKYKKCCLNSVRPPQETDPHAQLRANAYKQMADQNWTEAISLFKTLLEARPADHTLLAAVASCYEGRNEYLSAAEYYEKALKVCPQSKKADLWYHLGIARACAMRMEKAAEAFRSCIQILGHNESEKIRDLLRTVEDVLAGTADPRLFQVQVLFQRAFTDMEDERFESAAAKLETIASIEPDNPAIFYNLGVVYTFLKREDDALDQFGRAVDLRPEYAEAWYNMGQIFLIRQRDFSRALNCFERASAIRPDYIGAHHQKGVAYELIGDRENALKCWERTLELDPDNKQARENRARVQAIVQGRSAVREMRKDLP